MINYELIIPVPSNQDVEEPIECLDLAEDESITGGDVANEPTRLQEEIVWLETFEKEGQGLAVTVLNGEAFGGNRRTGEASWYLRWVVWIGESEVVESETFEFVHRTNRLEEDIEDISLSERECTFGEMTEGETFDVRECRL